MSCKLAGFSCLMYVLKLIPLPQCNMPHFFSGICYNDTALLWRNKHHELCLSETAGSAGWWYRAEGERNVLPQGKNGKFVFCFFDTGLFWRQPFLSNCQGSYLVFFSIPGTADDGPQSVFLVLRALLTCSGDRIMHGYGDSRTGTKYEAS